MIKFNSQFLFLFRVLASHLFASILVDLIMIFSTTTLEEVKTSFFSTFSTSTMNKWLSKPWLPKCWGTLPIFELHLPIQIISYVPQSVCSSLQSWISSHISSSSSTTSTRFRLSASTLVCLDPVQCTILKPKSCKILTHMPLMLYTYGIVANHFRSLWPIRNVKQF